MEAEENEEEERTEIIENMTGMVEIVEIANQKHQDSRGGVLKKEGHASSNEDQITVAAISSHDQMSQQNNVDNIQELDGDYDTARRYDEVVDMGDDHESLEDEVLEMGL